MLRNLNQTGARGRICGTPKSGVLGSLIPSTGDNGPGYTYNDLSLPADNNKDIRGDIVVWPSDGTLYAYEDTSFTFTAPDGTYTFQYQLYVDGVAIGSPATVTLEIGADGTTVFASPGALVYTGNSAGIASNISINASVATITKQGLFTTVNISTDIVVDTGTKTLQGIAADVALSTTMSCSTATNSFQGLVGNIQSNTGISCSVAAINKNGLDADIEVAVAEYTLSSRRTVGVDGSARIFRVKRRNNVY